MRRLASILIVLAALCARGADPYVGYIYPAGVQAGTTNRLIVGGQFFGNIKGAIAGEGVHVLDVEFVPNFPPPVGEQRRWMVKWLDQIATTGDRTQPRLPVESEHFSDWRSNRWYFALGELDVGKLALVEHFLYTPRNALQMSPALSQKLLVTVAADADAKPGAREFRVFSPQGFSPPRPLVVSAAPRVIEPLYVPPHRKQPETPVVTNIPCVLDGQIMPGSTDRWVFPLAKGRTITLRATAREFQPYIGDAVPGFFNPVLRIVDRQGRELALADDFHYHPDPVLTFTAPADDEYTLEVHDNLYRGREDFTYTIDVREGAWSPSPREFSLSPLPSWEIPADALVQSYDGVVAKPGRACRHAFTVQEPCELAFDLLARRAGSPLDARVTVWKGKTQIARVDDVTNAVHLGSVIQAECDPVGRVKFDAPGRYEFRVEDESGRGGADYFYTLRLHRPAPRCEVWCHKSGVALRSWWGGQRVRFSVIRRDGFDGSVTLEENAAVKFVPNVIPASSNRMDVTAVCKLQAPCEPTNVVITASAVVNGVHVAVPVTPANEYNQAFAWDHLVPARAFALRVFPGKPPKPKQNPRRAPPPQKKTDGKGPKKGG
ncbi:MAG: hypothetical protein ACI4RA_03440 [Kiritimatiellia bacterium]